MSGFVHTQGTALQASGAMEQHKNSAIIDTSFETKMMVKSGAIEIIFKSYEPFQSYLLTDQA